MTSQRIYIILHFLPSIVISLWIVQVSGQLLVNHPRNRVHHRTINHRALIAPPYASDDLNYSSKIQRNLENLSKLNETRLPETSKERNELLRRLSSTMLLEKLLQHPFPINKAPFPALSFPTSLLEDDRSLETNRVKNITEDRPYELTSTSQTNNLPNQSNLNAGSSRYREQSVSTAASIIDIATANLSKSIDADKSSMPYNRSNESTEIFNANALNYLVDKLLNSKPISLSNKTSQRRPTRQKPKNSSDADLYDTISDSKLPILTLDMLIKDEYDSRIKAMTKSLSEQQELSKPLHKLTSTSSGPSNHKLEDSKTINRTTTTRPEFNMTEVINDESLTTNIDNLEPVTPNTANTLVSFEDLTDLEESEEDDYNDNQTTQSPSPATYNLTSKPLKNLKNLSIRKSLQNVPPYQFLYHYRGPHINQSDEVKSTSPTLEAQTTTTDPVTFDRSNDTLHKSPGEKSTGASLRGSMVFSDGLYEADRSKVDKKKTAYSDKAGYGLRSKFLGKINSHNPTSNPQRIITRTSELTNPMERTDSFLLEQLLSTVNPLSELDSKLRNQFNKPSISMNNPLIYKGYVGKDDYLFSSTARDWSRPINARDVTTEFHKYPFGLSTTPTSPTEISSFPPLFHRHQHVTNAQSMPSSIVPTNGPFHETTTQSPLLYYRPNGRKNILQTPYIDSNHPDNIHQQPLKIKKYSYQLRDRHNKTSVLHYRPISLEGDLANNNMGQNRTTSWTPTKLYDGLENSKNDNQTHSNRNLFNNVKIATLTSPEITTSDSLHSKNKKRLPELNHAENESKESASNDTDHDDNNDPGQPSDKTWISPESNQQGSRIAGQRYKPKKSNSHLDKADPSGTDGSLGDEDNVQDDERYENSSYLFYGKVKKPLDDSPLFLNSKAKKGEVLTDVLDQSTGTNDEDSSSFDKSATRPRKNNNDKPHPRPSGGKARESVMKHNHLQTKNQTKVTFPITHEPAGSEISFSGVDKNLEFANDSKQKTSNATSSIKLKQKQQSKNPDTKIVDSADDIPSTVNPNTRKSVFIYSSTAVPNISFFGEASSESPTLYNTVGGGVDKTLLSTQLTPEDPYHRTISSTNNIIPDIQQPSSLPADDPKLLHPTTDFKLDESSSTISASGPGPVKPTTSKGSSDKLYLILIGGSFALSVVCLVVAVVSMRCQDMCDDYRSLRNAERAALKLQKHRLKYTKNHQVNHSDHHVVGNSDLGQSLIDELNNGGSIQADINNMRNSKFSAGNSDNKNNNNSPLNNFQQPFVGPAGKDRQSCRCGSCLNHRWQCQDNAMASNKNMSWLNHHYFMQHDPRLRPLFGAGSSVGTFFPRRVEEQATCHGGSTDAQILMDNQLSHSCLINDPHRAITRTKSILHKRELPCDILPANYGCNNPDHNHHIHQVSHNHHHHRIDPSTSEESEETMGESGHCENIRCLSNQNYRTKIKSKPHNHIKTAWKLGACVKNSYHQYQHQHRHQPVTSSDSGSLAQCTCNRDQQPLIMSSRHQNLEKSSHKHQSKQDSRTSVNKQASRDKSLLIWSTNRDRLI